MNKPKRNIWKDSPYGEHNGNYGSPDMWRAAFKERMSGREAAEILGETNPWRTLGLAVGASLDEIKAAFRSFAKKWHPDINKEDGAAEQFKLGLAAYTILTQRA